MKRYRIFTRWPVLFVVCALFCSCDERTVYHTFRSVPLSGWARQDTLSFDVSIDDTLSLYELYVEVRHRNDYPYSNLALLLSYTTPASSCCLMDTLQLNMADERGVWYGKGWSDLYLHTVHAGTLRLGRRGDYHFRLTGAMSDTLLRGLNDVGIMLRRSESPVASGIDAQEDE